MCHRMWCHRMCLDFLPSLSFGDSFCKTVKPHRKNVLTGIKSESCHVPHFAQVHSLIPRPALPFGLLDISPQCEQVWVVYFSFTISKRQPACLHLYSSCRLSSNQPASYTLLASLPFLLLKRTPH